MLAVAAVVVVVVEEEEQEEALCIEFAAIEAYCVYNKRTVVAVAMAEIVVADNSYNCNLQALAFAFDT